MFFNSLKKFILDILFPVFCLSCGQEGDAFCQDCRAILEVSEHRYCLCKKPIRLFNGGKCGKCRFKALDGLFSALPYQNPLIKRLMAQFKYEPYLVKELAKPLTSLVVSHFNLLEPPPLFLEKTAGYVLIPVPLHKKKLRRRGYNQAEEMAECLSKSLRMPALKKCLLKTRATLSQVELSEKDRENNVRGAFFCESPELTQGKKIFLVDDIYTTGSTMAECARVLKERGAKQVWGVVAARG